MSLIDLMKENDIDLNWVFTHSRLHGKEGLLFFEVVTKENDDTGEEEQFLDPKCILIDDAKFIYSDDIEKEIEINWVNDKVVFNRIDGLEVKLTSSDLKNAPFKLVEFPEKITKQGKPTDFVEIE